MDSFPGEVASSADDTLALLVPLRSPEWETLERGITQKLLVAPTGIVALEARRFDGLRSGLLAGAGTGLIIALLTHQLTGWFGGDTTQPEAPKDP
jgi:hypothetical protein